MSELTQLKPLNFGGWVTEVNTDLGYAPYFLSEIKRRMNKQLAVNVVVTGEAGIGKSYQAMQVCRVVDSRFYVEDVVSSYGEYMKEILREKKQGVPICFDEPQYALDKRDWYNQINKALVKTITSQRFRLRPVFIPIINLNLLDKVLRSYLIQFHVVLNNRGQGYAYRLQPSQFEEKIYRIRICRLDYGLFDYRKCVKSCLTCQNIETCEIFRAQYEKKKREWQDARDTQGMQDAIIKETPKLTDKDLVAILIHAGNTIMNGKEYDIQKIIDTIDKEQGLVISSHRAYDLKRALKSKSLKNPDFPPL